MVSKPHVVDFAVISLRLLNKWENKLPVIRDGIHLPHNIVAEIDALNNLIKAFKAAASRFQMIHAHGKSPLLPYGIKIIYLL
jgi:hypothetical protein